MHCSSFSTLTEVKLVNVTLQCSDINFFHCILSIQISDVLDTLPIVDVSLRLRTPGGDSGEIDDTSDTIPEKIRPRGPKAVASSTLPVACMPLTSRATAKHWLGVRCDEEYTLSVQLKRRQVGRKVKR